ncbi:hypothetical protein [Micromonospora vulcania]|uniref:Uncharacterized protein n=1 Tax=Micromonospora vulcania TaxID=1441873 RepID=A0ABW1H1Z1_9ACTN
MNPDPIDDLRDAWLATIAATDRAGAHLHGAGPPGRRPPWQDAVTECWRALSLVYAGVAASRDPAIWTVGQKAADQEAARQRAGSAGELLAGLHAAQGDADRATALATRVRHRLGAAEDRLRRTRIVADAVAARHLAAAITRLDLVVTRLAVGGRRIDRSVAALTGGLATPPVPRQATPAAAVASASATAGTGSTSTSTSTDEIARGCRAASALAKSRRRRGLMKLRMNKERRW